MNIPPKLMMGAGIAVAGLGLIGAGAGATFTAQVAGSTTVTTGDIGLSLNGRTGDDLQFAVAGSNLGTHFAPIRKELRLQNTGSLDLASTQLDVTATGCDGGDDAPLARSLRITVTDVTHSRQVYAGALCSGAGEQPPHPLGAGGSILYELVLQPSDAEQGLSPAALDSRTSVRIVFTGTDS
jgi:Camelysin metallo-endopeptidase